MQQQFVLVFNCGSSSIKFCVMNPENGHTPLNGIVQCVASSDASMQWKWEGKKESIPLPDVSYRDAIHQIIEMINVKDDLGKNIIAVGHRVVHGGERFAEAVLIDDEVIQAIRECADLAPLHNPVNIVGIEAAQEEYPNLPNVAVFDTAFHQTIPDYAYTYAVPYELYEEYKVRRYGFHGTSHCYVTRKAAELLDKPINQSAFISAHLGNGDSVCAVLNGQSLDTSMGITPLEGLVMGTRSGDIDPSLHGYLAEKLHFNVKEVIDLLNKKSGLLGISGVGGDMRSVSEAAKQGNKRAILAIEVFCYRLAKYIMSYVVPLGRLDAVIFTGGIGENNPFIRSRVLAWLKPLGFEIDEAHNANHGEDQFGIITKNESPVAMVIATNEELLISQEAKRVAVCQKQ